MMKKKILFLCTQNSCRSQMAEALLRHHFGEAFEVYSAGTLKSSINPWAKKVLEELGLDLSSHFSKTINELPQVHFDLVVTVCDQAKEICPVFLGAKMIHMGFEDPPKLAMGLVSQEEILAIYRSVRDQIGFSLKKVAGTFSGD